MAVVDKVQKEYWMLQKSATVTALLLPWFPSTGKKIKDIATKNLFTILEEYIKLRRQADVPDSDAIDLLLAYGSTTKDTITLILTIIFAGVINTGVTCNRPLFFYIDSPLSLCRSMLGPPLPVTAQRVERESHPRGQCAHPNAHRHYILRPSP